MQKKICCFAGHSLLSAKEVESKIEKAAEKLVCVHGVNEFWVGGYGDFDRLAQGAINKLKKRHPHIKLIYVVPYLSKIRNELKWWYEENFDGTMVADVPEKTPMRYRILKANQFMVDHAEYLLCYVTYEWGGAWQTMEYARRKPHIEVINLSHAAGVFR